MASRLFPLQLDEGDVRQLCGAAAFTRAADWQRSGHVMEPVAGLGTLTGEVRGTWQRVDAPSISAPGGKVQCTCTCQQPTLCSHGAALLLHWLRQPAAFTHEVPAAAAAFGTRQPESAFALDDFADDDADGDDPGLPDEPTVAGDLAKLLDLFSMADLRDVARRREVRPTGRTKAELSRQLAEALSTPENIDAALARLSPDEMLTLLCIDVLGPDLATPETVKTAVHVLGGAAAPTAVEALLAQALVGIVQYYGSPASTFAIPVAVTARLGRLPALARPLEREPPLAPEAGGLDLLQGLLVLVHEAQTRTIATRPDRETLPAERSTAPAYWSVLVPQQASAAKPGFATPYRQARLTPVPPMLERGEQQSLAQRMGRGNGFVTLAMHVALTLQILEATGELHAEPERLLNLCSLSPVVRRQVYVACLAAPHFLGELRRLLSEGGPLELHCHLGYFGQNTPLLNQAAQLRMLLLRAVDRLPRDVWYDYRSFRESLRHWAPFQSPGLSFAQVGRADRPTWWISDHQHPDQPLDLKTPTGWQQLYGRFVDDVFSGVLSWVGMIDLVVNADGPQAFRVRSLNVETADGRLHLGDDLTIQVPAGLTDSSAYSLLERGAELIHVSREGLRYRLTAERVRDLFAQGVDGPLLVRLLEGNARRSLPAILQSTLERWWTGYGQVRLYDDLTLIELADDYLLPELLRTTSLSSAIIYTFSPRLIAVEPAAVERLSGEMARAGHPPSIAEGR